MHPRHIVAIFELAVLRVEAPAADVSALRNDDTLRPRFRDLDLGGNGMGLVFNGSRWNFSAPPNTGRRPVSSRRKIPVSRLAISRATSNKFIELPEPVGHSMLKLLP